MIDEFRQTLIDAAPLIRGCQSVFRLDESTWAIAFEDGPPVTVAAEETYGRIILSTTVGRPEEALRGSTCEVLMVFNGLWRQSGGQRFGLEEPDGDIEFLQELPHGEMRVEQLVQAMALFVDSSRGWRTLIETHGGLDADEHRESLEPILGQGIRV